MRRIIWRAGRVASRSWKSASFVISSVSLPQNPTALTRPNARSTLTDRLACLRGGGGGEKRGMDEWKGEKKSPSSDWQAGRTDGAQFFQALSAGAVSSPFQHLLFPPPPLRVSAPLLPSPNSDLWTPWHSILPPFKRRTRTPSTTTSSLNVHQRAPLKVTKEQERPQCID